MHYCKKDLFTIKKKKKDESNNSKNIREDRSNPKKNNPTISACRGQRKYGKHKADESIPYAFKPTNIQSQVCDQNKK